MGNADLGELPRAREPLPRLTIKVCPECLGAGRHPVRRGHVGYITCGYCWGAGEVEHQPGVRTELL